MNRILITIAAVGLASTALAESQIDRSTIDGGGGLLQGARFTLQGSIGQPDAGVLAGQTYQISGGFQLPPTPGCPGDLNGDQTVNSSDLNILLSAFGQSDLGDLDDDGDTDSADLNILLAAFGDDTCG